MNILVVYDVNRGQKTRNALLASIFCYKDYKDIHFYHYNYCGKLTYLGNYLKRMHFDAVIFHYSFLATMRWGTKEDYECILDFFRESWNDSIKAIIPQDEYYKTGLSRRFITETDVEIIYSLASKNDIDILYPDTPNVKKYTVLTGYVDGKTFKKVERIKRECTKERKYDIGYRARKVNYALGKHGNLKAELVNQMNKRLSGSDLVTNIKNTIDDKNVFWGDDWYRFLLDCKTVVGCNGGASIMDVDGTIESRVNQFLKMKSNASFKEVEDAVLYNVDGNIQYKMISPRIFEAAMTKTCQILVRDNYGPLKAGVHYIELSEDYSNIDEVIEKVRDTEYCRKIADNAYQLLIASGDYSYTKFVRKVVNSLKKKMRDDNKKETTKEYRYVKLLLWIHELVLFIYNKIQSKVI